MDINQNQVVFEPVIEEAGNQIGNFSIGTQPPNTYYLQFTGDILFQQEDWQRVLHICNTWNQSHSFPTACLHTVKPEQITPRELDDVSKALNIAAQVPK